MGAGPGDPELITWRGVELLQQADVVLFDALSHPDLLKLCPQAEIRDVGKRAGQRATPQHLITNQLIELAQEGKRVVRLKGGDPLLFARGAEEALALRAAGVRFEIVPGVTSPVAASAFAGIPLTHRDASSSVTFITGTDQEGKSWSPQAWKKLATATGTICIFMGMRRIREITRALIEGGREGSTPAAAIRWGARPVQRTVVGCLSDISERVEAEGLTSPAMIVVGEVISLREQMRWYDNKPLFGCRVVIPRPRHQAGTTAKLVRQRGAIPVLAPAIEIVPPRESAALRSSALRADSYDWVVFTSQNGVDAFFDQIKKLRKDARVFGRARIGVIGPKTAASLERYGITADLVAQEYVAESLAAQLLLAEPPPGRLLLVRAAEAREVLPQMLREAGVAVDVVEAYQTRLAEGAAAQVLCDAVSDSADAVLLSSSSMARSLVQALGSEAATILKNVAVASIGPVTTSALRELGIEPDLQAEKYTVPGLLDALERHFEAS